MGNQHEENGADGGGGERIKKASAENTKAHEDPAADKRADDAENDVGDAAEAAATRDFSGEPSGNQADDDPAPEAVWEVDRNTFRLDQGAEKCGGHATSKWFDAICKRNGSEQSSRGVAGASCVWRGTTEGGASPSATASRKWAAAGSCSGVCRGRGRGRGRRCR